MLIVIVLVMISLQVLLLRYAVRLHELGKTQYGGLRRIALVGIGSTALFGLLAGTTRSFLPLLRFESALGGQLHLAEPEVIIRLIEQVADHDRWLFAAVGLAGMLLLIRQQRWPGVVLWVGTLGGGLLALEGVKQGLHMPRLAAYDALDLGSIWEYPSGHAFGVVVVAGLIWYSWGQGGLWQRPRLAAALLAVILIVGAIRLVVGTHYLGDVLAGYLLGVAWLALAVTAHAVGWSRRIVRQYEADTTAFSKYSDPR